MGSETGVIGIDLERLRQLIKAAVREALDEEEPAMTSPDQVLSPRQVARLFRVADESVYDALAEGKLRAKREGTRWKIRHEDACAWSRKSSRR